MKKLLFPIIKKYWKLLLATMLITAFGCGYTIGLAGSYLSIEDTMDDYLERYRYPDAVFTTEVTDRSRLAAVRQVPGIRAVNARLCADTSMKDHAGRYLTVRVFACHDDDLPLFHFHETADGGGLYSVYLEYDFAQENGIHAGDTLSFKVGDEWREVFVSGLVSMPETLSVQPTNDLVNLNADFGYAYASSHILKVEYDKVYSEAKQELEEKSDELEDAKEDADEELDSARQKLDEAGETLKEKESLLADSEMEASEKKWELTRTRAALESAWEELDARREELIKGRSTARNTLDQLFEQQSRLQEAVDGLAAIDSNLSAVIEQQNALQSGDVVMSMDLLRQAPSSTRISSLSASAASLQDLINAAQAYGFYYNVNDSVAGVAADLRSFISDVQSDAAYLSSEEARAVVSRIENGEAVAAETPEYQAVAAVTAKYAAVGDPAELPAAYYAAVFSTDEILRMVSLYELDAAAERLTAFDSALTLSAISARIDELMSAVVRLENAMGSSFDTVGELVAAYDGAVTSLASARAELERARAQIEDALAGQGLSESELSGAVPALNASIQTLESTIEEIDDGIPQIDDSMEQIEDGIAEIDAGIAEIDRQLAEAKAQLEEAKTDLEEGESTYRESLADALLELSDLEDELASAYAELEDGHGYDELCNQFLLWFEDGVDPEAVLSQAEAALDGVQIKSGYTYERSAIKNRIDLQLDPIGTMSTFIPAVFFTVILVIVFLFMSLIVRQCRREIGILRALGYTTGSIRRLFAGVSLVVSLGAVILGFGLGCFVTWYVGVRYVANFNLPMYNMRIDWGRSVILSVSAIVVYQIATFISTGLVVKIRPAEAMSRPAPGTVHIPGLLGRFTRKAAPMTAFSITTLLRNPVRFFFSVVCVAASIMMIFGSLAVFTSRDYTLDQTYNKRFCYDCQVFFMEPLSEELLSEIRSLDFVEEARSLPYYQMDISFGGRTASALINAVDADTDLVGIYDREGQRLVVDLPENGIILEEHLAEEIGARVGDTVLADGRAALRVEGISFQCISRFQYISQEGAKTLGDETLGSLICRIDERDEQRLLSFLAEQEDYLFASFTRRSYEENVRQLASFNIAAWFTIGFAFGIGFIIVLNTARTNILEKKKELCVLRTLGFQRWEISRSWFSQCILQFFSACILGFPLGGTMAKLALAKLSSPSREYVYANTPRELFITAVCVFTYITLSHFAAMHDMKGWDIVESVKEKE